MIDPLAGSLAGRAEPGMVVSKSFDTHGPFGPWIVTTDEIGDPRSADTHLRQWRSPPGRSARDRHAERHRLAPPRHVPQRRRYGAGRDLQNRDSGESCRRGVRRFPHVFLDRRGQRVSAYAEPLAVRHSKHLALTAYDDAPRWIRTTGLSLRRGSLYPAELSGRGPHFVLVGLDVTKNLLFARHARVFRSQDRLHERYSTTRRVRHPS